MTTAIICDRCKQQKPKEEIIYIIGYPKIKIMKSGYKSLLNKDICKICYNEVWGEK